MDLDKLRQEQLKLAKKLLFTDHFDKIKMIGGIDYLYTETDVICSIVLLDFKTTKLLEHTSLSEKLTFPYIPGFLSYRAAPVTLKAFEKLKNKPDLLMISGNGLLHPRKIGLASAIGLFLDLPTIGIAKKQLCGEEIDGVIYLDKEVIGKKFYTKEKANPIFVSQGHKISLKSTIEIVKEMTKGHKMPEPIHVAHKYGNKAKAGLK